MAPLLKLLKLLKMGLISYSLYQMKAFSKKISKMPKKLGSFIKEVQKAAENALGAVHKLRKGLLVFSWPSTFPLMYRKIRVLLNRVWPPTYPLYPYVIYEQPLIWMPPLLKSLKLLKMGLISSSLLALNELISKMA